MAIYSTCRKLDSHFAKRKKRVISTFNLQAGFKITIPCELLTVQFNYLQSCKLRPLSSYYQLHFLSIQLRLFTDQKDIAP